DVLKPTTFLPRLKILSIPTDMDPDVVLRSLQAQKARLIRTIPRNREKHLVFEIDSLTYGRLVNKYVFEESTFTSFRAVPFHEVPMCTQCLRPGHSAKHCRHKAKCPKPLCAKCGKDDHLSADCTETTMTCINCNRAHL